MLVPLTVGIAYLITFAYEAGFIVVFRIPVEVVRLNLSTLAIVASALMVVLPVSWYVFRFAVGNRHSGGRLVLCGLLELLVFLAVYHIYAGQGGESDRVVLGVVAILLFLLAVFGYLRLRKARTLPSLPQQWRLEVYGALVALFLCAAVWTAFATGRKRALTQTWFYVTNSAPAEQLAVLRAYGDLLVCAPFAQDSRQLKPCFVFWKMSEGVYRLDLANIGPLIPPKIDQERADEPDR